MLKGKSVFRGIRIYINYCILHEMDFCKMKEYSSDEIKEPKFIHLAIQKEITPIEDLKISKENVLDYNYILILFLYLLIISFTLAITYCSNYEYRSLDEN